MAFIQKTTVPMSFQGGLQAKTDSIQVQPPSLLSLTNAKFDKVGALNKRPGYDILSTQVTQGNDITSAVAIDSFNSELNLFDNKNIFTYISSLNSWANRGPAISLINSNQQVIRTVGAQQINPDSNFLNDVEVFAWEDSRGGVRYSVIDLTTQAYCVADRPIAGSLAKPKVIVFNNLFYIFYTANNNLFYRTISPNNPSVISPQVSLIADGATDFKYDCAVGVDHNLYISYFGTTSATAKLYLFFLNTSNVKSAITTVASGSVAVNDPTYNAVSVVTGQAQEIWVSWSSGTDVKVRQYLSDLPTPLSIFGPQTIDTVICSTITGIESLSPGSLQLVYEIKDLVLASNESCKSAIIQYTGSPTAVVTPVGTLRSVGLATKPFVYNGNIFVHLAFESTLQSTYFMALLSQAPFTIVSKVAPQVGGGLRTNGMLPEIVNIVPGKLLWANLIKGIFISEDNTNFSLLGVNSTVSDFTNINKFNSVTYSDNLLFVGGILQNYDGIAVNEQNFHVFPEDVQAVIQPGGGALSAGQYQYQAVYAWTDKFGQIQYSSPSPTVTVTTAVNDAVRVVVPTLRLTAKTGVAIKIYRTQVNQVIFQEVTSELAPLLNNPNVNFVVFTDTAADVNIAGNQAIYTTGGVLPNSAPPSCGLISLYNDRVIISGLEDPNLLWFSKNKINNSNFNTIPVEFSQSLTVGVNQLGGPITALGLMDQNLIIFKNSAIFVMSGEGPNDEGGGNNFQDPQLITQLVGCTNPNSIILTGQGIMFQTPDKGIWLLDRSLGPPSYIGAGVDDLAKQYLVSSANLDQNSNSVIFTTFQGPALVYDYLIGQWATWTNHQSVDAVNFENEFTFCKANGKVYTQNQGIFYDGYQEGLQVPYSMEITTPWISYSQLLGYQSIFRTFIVGQYKGPHQLSVELGYNFNTAFTKSVIINSTAIVGSNVWGSDAAWGLSELWGGGFYGFAGSVSWQPYVFQVNMPIQKCTSMRMRIMDVQSSPYNEGYTISGLLFELGALPDGVRVPKTNKVGAR